MARDVDRVPFVVVVPVTGVLFALGMSALRLTPLMIGGAALLGMGWSLVLGLVIVRVQRNNRWRARAADAPVFLAVVASGLLLGGGLMYGLLMTAAVDAPPAVLSAMMQPTIPYFIVANTLMEWLFVPAALYSNWHAAPRRPFVVIASALYYVMRVWTYSTYASQRLEIAGRSLSAEDIEWFRRTMSVDYRGALVALTLVFFLWAAFVPVSRDR